MTNLTVKTNNLSLQHVNYYYKQAEAEQLPGDVLFKYGMKQFSKVKNVSAFIKLAKESDNPQFYEICNKNVKLFADIGDQFF